MPEIIVQPMGQHLDAALGENLLTVLHKHGFLLDNACGGKGTCGKCLVRLHQADAEPVLACEVLVEKDFPVFWDAQKSNGGMRILAEGVRGEHALAPRVAHGLGIAVDIGTTTLVLSLVSLEDGHVLNTQSSLNPQTLRAQDVLGRIQHGSTEEGLAELRADVVNEIHRLAQRSLQHSKAQATNVFDIVLSGNTTMLHLAAGASPRSLGVYPYVPELALPCVQSAQDYWPNYFAADAQVYLPPSISAYVGADIVAGILATNLDKPHGTVLFIDIGTNGEMVLASPHGWSASSTAAGPAFEGMNIQCGMRASSGAIERVELDAKGIPSIRTIDDATAVGLCGSGLLDAVAELARCEIIDSTGRFNKAACTLREGKSVFELTSDVYLTQKDIRQVQLAKGAVRAGVDLLLEELGVKAAEVDQVLIAGSFGYHLRSESLLNLGLLPQEFQGKIEFSGNTSRIGAERFLLDIPSRVAMEQFTPQVSLVELSRKPHFQKVFMDALAFPTAGV